MSVADLIVLALIVAILALASFKVIRDRRRARAMGGEMLPICVGCPIATQCESKGGSCSTGHRQRSVSSSCSCH